VGLALLIAPGIRGHLGCLKVSEDTLTGRKRRRAERCRHSSREITVRNHSRGDIYSISPCAFVNLPLVWDPIRSLIPTFKRSYWPLNPWGSTGLDKRPLGILYIISEAEIHLFCPHRGLNVPQFLRHRKDTHE
jgi:hypothetical protein